MAGLNGAPRSSLITSSNTPRLTSALAALAAQHRIVLENVVSEQTHQGEERVRVCGRADGGFQGNHGADATAHVAAHDTDSSSNPAPDQPHDQDHGSDLRFACVAAVHHDDRGQTLSTIAGGLSILGARVDEGKRQFQACVGRSSLPMLFHDVSAFAAFTAKRRRVFQGLRSAFPGCE